MTDALKFRLRNASAIDLDDLEAWGDAARNRVKLALKDGEEAAERIESLEAEVKALRDHIEALNQFGKKRRSDLEAEVARLKDACHTALDWWHTDHPNDTFEGIAAHEKVKAALTNQTEKGVSDVRR